MRAYVYISLGTVLPNRVIIIQALRGLREAALSSVRTFDKLYEMCLMERCKTDGSNEYYYYPGDGCHLVLMVDYGKPRPLFNILLLLVKQ